MKNGPVKKQCVLLHCLALNKQAPPIQQNEIAQIHPIIILFSNNVEQINTSVGTPHIVVNIRGLLIKSDWLCFLINNRIHLYVE